MVESFKSPLRLALSLILLSFVSIGVFAAMHVVPDPWSDQAYFASALAQHNVITTVRIGDTHYRVVYGHVIPNTEQVSLREERAVLALAYEHTMAIRSPLGALPGIDLDEFERAVDVLERSRSVLVTVQQTQKEHDAIRRALYPIRFLRAAAEAERARRAFTHSGSMADAMHYRQQLTEMLDAYRHDIGRFSQAFIDLVPRDAPSYATEQEKVSYDSMRASFTVLRERIEDLGEQHRARIACVRGVTHACSSRDLSLPQFAIPTTGTVEEIDEEIWQETIAEIRAIYLASGGIATEPVVYVLAKSVCVDPQRVPPFFVFREHAEETFPIPVGNLRFIDATEYTHEPYLAAHVRHGVRFVLLNELNHYSCMRSNEDVGRLYAMRTVRRYALEHPLSDHIRDDATRQRLADIESRITSSWVKETDTLAYTQLALQTIDQTPQSHSAESVIDMAVEVHARSAGFAETIERIAYLNNETTTNVEFTPVPAIQLFYVRSGFFALSAASNATFGDTDELVLEAESRADPFLYYTDLSPEERARARHDVQHYKDVFESSI